LPLYLDEADAKELVDMAAAIAAVREAFTAQARGEALNVPRTRLQFWSRRLNVMAGGMRAPARFAVKAYGGSAHHVFLYAEEEGLLAVIEADLLGQLRTGAANAVAAERLARPDARRVGLIGAGRHARTQALGLRAISRLDELTVFARNRASLDDFCAALAAELGVPVHAGVSAEAAAAGADIVVTATTSSQPVLRGAWIAPGTHVNAMGANAASRRELDSDLVLRAALVVTDDVAQAQGEAGELIELAAAGRLEWEKVKPLHEIVGDGFRRDRDAITLFKSLGAGLEDVAIASLVYDRAKACGHGRSL
jgi:ornithine cyclodeaminase/alanine dehydrogenase-like protein (mu-crystallin family)